MSYSGSAYGTLDVRNIPGFAVPEGFTECRNPKFVKAATKCPGEPYWALLYSSPLRGKGTAADWMADATDLAGRPRLRDGKVDIGCYQCWLNLLGVKIIVR